MRRVYCWLNCEWAMTYKPLSLWGILENLGFNWQTGTYRIYCYIQHACHSRTWSCNRYGWEGPRPSTRCPPHIDFEARSQFPIYISQDSWGSYASPLAVPLHSREAGFPSYLFSLRISKSRTQKRNEWFFRGFMMARFSISSGCECVSTYVYFFVSVSRRSHSYGR